MMSSACLARAAAAETVDGVGQPVEVQPAGEHAEHGERDRGGEQAARTESPPTSTASRTAAAAAPEHAPTSTGSHSTILARQVLAGRPRARHRNDREHGHGGPPGRDRGPRLHRSRRAMPAVHSQTSSHAAAMRELSQPSSSRNRRPDAVAGTIPQPTSLLTATACRRVSRQASTSPSVLRASPEPASSVAGPHTAVVHDLRQPGRDAVDEDRRRPCLARPVPRSTSSVSIVRQCRGAPVPVGADPLVPFLVTAAWPLAGGDVVDRAGAAPASPPRSPTCPTGRRRAPARGGLAGHRLSPASRLGEQVAPARARPAPAAALTSRVIAGRDAPDAVRARPALAIAGVHVGLAGAGQHQPGAVQVGGHGARA